MKSYLEILEAAISEDGRIVKGVNTTCDVGEDEIITQAAKFGNKVTKDGRPPLLWEEESRAATYWVNRLVRTFNDSPQQINNGWCWGFANRLAKKLGSHAKVVTTTGHEGAFPGHSAVEYKGRFYDAETPQGAVKLSDLGYSKRLRAFLSDPEIEDSYDGLMDGKRKA